MFFFILLEFLESCFNFHSALLTVGRQGGLMKFHFLNCFEVKLNSEQWGMFKCCKYEETSAQRDVEKRKMKGVSHQGGHKSCLGKTNISDVTFSSTKKLKKLRRCVREASSPKWTIFGQVSNCPKFFVDFWGYIDVCAFWHSFVVKYNLNLLENLRHDFFLESHPFWRAMFSSTLLHQTGLLAEQLLKYQMSQLSKMLRVFHFP